MNYKKKVYLTGVLALPLKVGVRALIRCGGETISTSPVVKIFESAPDKVCFETMNSIYHVSTAPIPLRLVSQDVLPLCA